MIGGGARRQRPSTSRRRSECSARLRWRGERRSTGEEEGLCESDENGGEEGLFLLAELLADGAESLPRLLAQQRRTQQRVYR